MADELCDFLLKECYEIAERYEPMEIPKMILREKSKNIKLLEEITPHDASLSSSKSYMQSVSEIMYELSMEGLGGETINDFPLSHVVSSIPECAEKNYILALLELRRGTNETQRLSALQYLSSALSEEPNDPRFRALAQILKEA